MNILNMSVLLFLLGAFAIGIAVTDIDKQVMEDGFDNATMSIRNIEIEQTSSNPYITRFYETLEYYIKFVGTLFVNIFRVGVDFGYNNPDYFTPNQIINVMKIIVFTVVLMVLIKPITFLFVLIILGLLAIRDKLKKRKAKRLMNKNAKD